MRAVTALKAAGRTDPGCSERSTRTGCHVDAVARAVHRHRRRRRSGRRRKSRRRRLERAADAAGARDRAGRDPAFAKRSRSPTTRSIGWLGTRPEWNGMACVAHGRGRRRRARDRRPRGRHAALQAVAGRHRESDARPLARRRAGRCRRGLRTRGDAPSPAQRGVSRRRLGACTSLAIPNSSTSTRFAFDPDSALLLCSDGLTDLIESSAIAHLVARFAGDPDRVANALIDAAKDAGGKDNVTVVYVEGADFKTIAGDSVAADTTRQLRDDRTGHPSNRERHVRVALLVLVAVLLVLSVVSLPGPLPVGRNAFAPSPSSLGRLVVRPGESIAAALKQVSPGGEIVVEPGEYREAVSLVNDVRLVSRIPGGAVLRLPATAGETDAAAIASGIAGAAFVGFRIVGDAATPLGTGLLVQDSELSVIDTEISGAANVAIDIAGTSQVSVMASDVHDNPGAAFAVRAGASARISHNVFQRNGVSPNAPHAGHPRGERRPHPRGQRVLRHHPGGIPRAERARSDGPRARQLVPRSTRAASAGARTLARPARRAAMIAPPGFQVGPYTVLGPAGRGGMADVFIATDTRTGRRVALKIVPVGDDQEARQIVEAEREGAEYQKQLWQVYRQVPEVYQYAHRRSVFLHRDGVPRWPEPVRGDRRAAPCRRRAPSAIAIQICRFLEAAHTLEPTIDGRKRRSLLHGDLKPRNIRVLNDDEVKVFDFGAAKALSFSRKVTRHDFGSIAYLSPERIESGDIDAHADFWGVGVILYEMVSGMQPFQAKDTRRLESRIRSRACSSALEQWLSEWPARCRDEAAGRRTARPLRQRSGDSRGSRMRARRPRDAGRARRLARPRGGRACDPTRTLGLGRRATGRRRRRGHASNNAVPSADGLQTAPRATGPSRTGRGMMEGTARPKCRVRDGPKTVATVAACAEGDLAPAGARHRRQRAA